MKGIIDRFEGNLVVVEIGNSTKDFDKAIFPKEAAVGDAVEIDGNHVSILKEETEKRRKEIEQLMDDVFE
ncbi:DUF3006 domain-containing protein [[Brevibacterium] frigoritolerans]|nr:DUF3006 domain-containing protein [Peribacillus frigoritolerans]